MVAPEDGDRLVQPAARGSIAGPARSAEGHRIHRFSPVPEGSRWTTRRECRSMGLLTRSLWQGAVAGAAGVAVMTLGEKVEQRFTGRPDSFMPARVLERLLHRPEVPGRQPASLNWTMHAG